MWTKDSLADHPKEVSTPEGKVFPITIEGLKILGSPLGTCDFSERLFTDTGQKVEQDLFLLHEFPHIQLRMKLATFCTNMRISYFLRTVPQPVSDPIVKVLDSSFDALCADRY